MNASNLHSSVVFNPKTKKGTCKQCGIDLCLWCDDHERRVCVFCMDDEHRELWRKRVKQLQVLHP